MIILPQELDLIKSLMQPGESLYLVGGAIRDALLCKPNNDLDFVGTGDPRIIGRKLADKLQGAFFILDDERNACRVIAKNKQGRRLVFDFTLMRGASLFDDLVERDFTINAMAANLDNPGEIIDPLKGEKDLLEKRLRPCKDSSFVDDPLRVIRAIRYSTKYDLKIGSSTSELLKMAINRLTSVSKERKRDELFKIFDVENPWIAVKLLVNYEILPHIISADLPDSERAFSRLRSYVEMVNCLVDVESIQGTNNLNAHSFCTAYLDISKFLRAHFTQVNQSERSIQTLDGLITIIWDMGESEGERAVEGLALSREEQEQISLALSNKCLISDYYSSNNKPDRKFIYRYFHKLGVTGLDLAILTLVEAAINHSDGETDPYWSGLVKFTLQLVETWYMNQDYVNPKLFLTGRDLMFEFDLPQSPQIGALLEGLREEQAIGSIQNRTQALAWVDGQIQKGFLDR